MTTAIDSPRRFEFLILTVIMLFNNAFKFLFMQLYNVTPEYAWEKCYSRVKTFKMMLGLLLDIRVLLILIIAPDSFTFYVITYYL